MKGGLGDETIIIIIVISFLLPPFFGHADADMVDGHASRFPFTRALRSLHVSLYLSVPSGKEKKKVYAFLNKMFLGFGLDSLLQVVRILL